MANYSHFDKESLITLCKNNFIPDDKRDAILAKVDNGDDTLLDDLRSIQGDIFDPDDLDAVKDLINYAQVVQKQEGKA
ncbi:hypothetical protein [uncultured Duncaniella sp.]|uniref:hypothetical protein n=1 Tax=uncultured Duncaniella sp. TaxID=2768039 RepID=UPI002624908E|nr:hypothetical protein [uncultured Duncaniella sp.]